jgi:hypothetical protein
MLSLRKSRTDDTRTGAINAGKDAAKLPPNRSTHLKTRKLHWLPSSSIEIIQTKRFIKRATQTDSP